MNVLVFGGTVEGRELVEWLAERGRCDVVACTATGYGASLVDGLPRVQTISRPLSHAEKVDLVQRHGFCCIVDATHPYAEHISQSIDELAASTGLDVVRIWRDEGDMPCEGCLVAADANEAAQLASRLPGNVLLTTGTNDLAAFASAIGDYEERLYVRVLPVCASLDAARAAGIPTSHIIAMQGPFSERLNMALIQELDIRVLVTKQSGKAGGFDEKVRAARQCGIQLVVIRRPQAAEGITLEEAKSLLEERYGL